MKRALVGLALLACANAGAAEPAAPTGAAQSPSPAKPAVTQATPPAPLKRLDLRVGDVRNYMMPDEYLAMITGRDDEQNTIVVQADAPLLPMKSQLDVPGGIIAPFWALAHPTQAWRLFLPDARVNIKNIPPAETKIPPPFRAGVPTF